MRGTEISRLGERALHPAADLDRRARVVFLADGRVSGEMRAHPAVGARLHALASLRLEAAAGAASRATMRQ